MVPAEKRGWRRTRTVAPSRKETRLLQCHESARGCVSLLFRLCTCWFYLDWHPLFFLNCYAHGEDVGEGMKEEQPEGRLPLVFHIPVFR